MNNDQRFDPEPIFQPPVVRDAILGDAKAIADIYNHYVFNTTATFEEKEVTPNEINRRMERIHSAHLPYLVLDRDGRLCGFCYAGMWKEGPALQRTVEAAIYLHPLCTWQGYGTLLYETLIKQLTRWGAHAIIAGVALPNPAGIALHKKLGFVEVALLREVGWKFKRWIDVTYWEMVTGV